MSDRSIPQDMLDDRGRVVGYHSGSTILTRGDLKPFLHLGNIAQARMRSGRELTRIVARTGPVARLVDRNENSWSENRLRPLLRKGMDWAVYLNRTEGIGLEEFEEARRRHARFDEVSDALFRRLVPSARDSLILLDPALVIEIGPA